MLLPAVNTKADAVSRLTSASLLLVKCLLAGLFPQLRPHSLRLRLFLLLLHRFFLSHRFELLFFLLFFLVPVFAPRGGFRRFGLLFLLDLVFAGLFSFFLRLVARLVLVLVARLVPVLVACLVLVLVFLLTLILVFFLLFWLLVRDWTVEVSSSGQPARSWGSGTRAVPPQLGRR